MGNIQEAYDRIDECDNAPPIKFSKAKWQIGLEKKCNHKNQERDGSGIWCTLCGKDMNYPDTKDVGVLRSHL